MSKQREYPFTAYVLTPSMLVKKIELESADWFPHWHKTIDGSSYHEDSLHDTPQSAIAAGCAKLDKQRAKLDEQQANLDREEREL